MTLGQLSFTNAVTRCIKGLVPPDLVYAHFLHPSGAAALSAAQHFKVPAVLALGESSIERTESYFGRDTIIRRLQSFDYLIAVSQPLRDYCIEIAGIDPRKVALIPNGVDLKKFRPFNQSTARQRLGLPLEPIIVAFTGQFIERKGPHRLLAAIEHLPDVRVVMLGSGSKIPQHRQVLFAGAVEHKMVPTWLAAADIFALPTLAEGNANAINEAMAVGLPIVSSNIPAIQKQVGPDAGILVPPLDVTEIARAIEQLAVQHSIRKEMSEAALARGRAWGVKERASKIRQILQELTNGSHSKGIRD